VQQVIVVLFTPGLRNADRLIGLENNVVAKDILASNEPHMRLKKVVDNHIVLNNPEVSLAQFDSAIQHQVVVDLVVAGTVVKVDIPSVITAPAVVAQDDWLDGIESR